MISKDIERNDVSEEGTEPRHQRNADGLEDPVAQSSRVGNKDAYRLLVGNRLLKDFVQGRGVDGIREQTGKEHHHRHDDGDRLLLRNGQEDIGLDASRSRGVGEEGDQRKHDEEEGDDGDTGPGSLLGLHAQRGFDLLLAVRGDQESDEEGEVGEVVSQGEGGDSDGREEINGRQGLQHRGREGQSVDHDSVSQEEEEGNQQSGDAQRGHGDERSREDAIIAPTSCP